MTDAPEISAAVDTIWERFWAAGVSDPLIAVEQISYFILLKHLDMTQARLSDGREPAASAFNGHPQLRWNTLSSLPESKALAVLSKELIPLLARSWGPAFERAMEGARVTLHDPSLVRTCLTAIEQVGLNQRGTAPLAAIYEALLGQLQLSGGRGQFQTPPSLRRLMIELVDPKPEETICDPAAGTGGLLVEAADHLRKAGGEPGAGDLRGYDISEGMARLAAINLVLHGVTDPAIEQGDTLANDFTHHKSDIVVANPPFGDLLSRRTVHQSLSNAGGRTELLFLELCRHLLLNRGRAAVLVPQAVLFGKTRDFVSVRQNWLERGRVIAVVALPTGILDQYLGVRTAIVLASAWGVTDEVWFCQLPEGREGPTTGETPDPYLEDVAAAVKSKLSGPEPPNPRASALAEDMWSASIAEIKRHNWNLMPSLYRPPEAIEQSSEDPLELVDQIAAGQAEIDERLREARRLLEEA